MCFAEINQRRSPTAQQQVTRISHSIKKKRIPRCCRFRRRPSHRVGRMCRDRQISPYSATSVRSSTVRSDLFVHSHVTQFDTPPSPLQWYKCTSSTVRLHLYAHSLLHNLILPYSATSVHASTVRLHLFAHSLLHNLILPYSATSVHASTVRLHLFADSYAT